MVEIVQKILEQRFDVVCANMWQRVLVVQDMEDVNERVLNFQYPIRIHILFKLEETLIGCGIIAPIAIMPSEKVIPMPQIQFGLIVILQAETGLKRRHDKRFQ